MYRDAMWEILIDFRRLIEKSEDISCFEVLDGPFRQLKTSPVTWTSFMEAQRIPKFFYSAVNFFQFLVIKILDTDPDRKKLVKKIIQENYKNILRKNGNRNNNIGKEALLFSLKCWIRIRIKNEYGSETLVLKWLMLIDHK